MAIDYIARDHVLTIECDAACGEIAVYYGSFQECIEAAKRDGWQIENDGGEWFHYCKGACRDNDCFTDLGDCAE